MRTSCDDFIRQIGAIIALLLLLALASFPGAAQNSIQYFYDDLGRLATVVDQNGNVATYSYDAAGNILSISRSTAGANQVAIFNFTPQSGPVGQVVTIQGQGFNSTPASDTVQINGATATVATATSTTLVVSVPAGATTGPISVKVGSTTATSGTNFTVTSQVSSIAVSPSHVSFHIGTQLQQQFTATASFTGGTPQNITASASWTSSNAAVATVSNTAGAQGLATVVGPGTTTIAATSGSVTGSAILIIASPASMVITPSPVSVPVQATQQLKAIVTFTDGTSQDMTSQVSWFSVDATTASVTSGGLVTGVKQGSTNVCASLTGIQSACSSLTVVPVLLSLSITPANQSLPKGLSQQFTATGSYNDGSTQNLTTSVTWSSSNPAVATIGTTGANGGFATETGLGSTNIQAVVGTITGSTTLTLTAPVPASLKVAPGVASVQVGNTLQLDATVVLTDGTTQDVTTTATWSSSNPAVATVSNQGLVTGVAVGSATITATSGTVSGSSSVGVSTGTATVYPRFLYTSDDAGNIDIFSVSSQTGQVRRAGAVPVASQAGTVALDPTQSYLYVSYAGSSPAGNLAAFAVNPTNGSISQIAGSPYSAGAGPIVTSGGFVYVGNKSSGLVSGFQIGAGGALTPLAGSPYLADGHPTALIAHPSGKFLFVLYSAQNVQGIVSVYSIDSSSGVLTEIPGSPFSTGYNPVSMAEDPAGRFLYVLNSGQNLGSSLHPLDRPNRLHFDPQLAKSQFAGPPGGITELDSQLGSSVPRYFGGLREDGSRSRGEWDSGLLLASLDASEVPLFPATAVYNAAIAANALFAFPPQSSPSTGPEISAFSIDPASGGLTVITGAPFPLTNTSSTAIMVDTTGSYAYVNTGTSTLGFAIGTSGVLTQLAGSPYLSGTFVGNITFDPSGQFAFAPGGRGLVGLAINSSTGALTLLTAGGAVTEGANSLALSQGPVPITYLPEFAYVTSSGASSGANSISGYSISASTGALAPLSGSPFSEGYFPVYALTDVLDQYLYVANNCSDPACSAANGSVSVYPIDPDTGLLTAATGSPFAAGTSPVSVVIQGPASPYVYAVSSNGLIYDYSSTPNTGGLTVFPGSPEATSAGGALAAAIDPNGILLYVAAKCSTCTSGTLYGYDLFLYNGQLIYQPAVITSALGPSPQSISVDPVGTFLLVTDGTSNSVYVFNTLGYTQVAGSPFAAGQNPMGVTMDPWARFVYVANQGSNNVSGYMIDPNAGVLTPIAGSPFSTGLGPVSAAVDFSGEFLYVTNNGDSTVSVFSINSTSGALTPIAGSPFPTGVAPISVVTTGTTQ